MFYSQKIIFLDVTYLLDVTVCSKCMSSNGLKVHLIAIRKRMKPSNVDLLPSFLFPAKFHLDYKIPFEYISVFSGEF